MPVIVQSAMSNLGGSRRLDSFRSNVLSSVPKIHYYYS